MKNSFLKTIGNGIAGGIASLGAAEIAELILFKQKIDRDFSNLDVCCLGQTQVINYSHKTMKDIRILNAAGRLTVDITDIIFTDATYDIDILTVCGKTTIILPKNVFINRKKSNLAGKIEFETNNDTKGMTHLINISAKARFGSIHIIQKKNP